MKRQVTDKQIVSGMTTAGPLAVLLSRFILWISGESVEKELVEELNRVDAARERAESEIKYLKGMLDERYETEWKPTKDGKRRYRRVATKVLVNAWHTESEPLDLELEKARAEWDELTSVIDPWDGAYPTGPRP